MGPLLYTIIKEKLLNELLETFYNCQNLPVQVLDEQGKTLTSFGDSHNYCEIFKRFHPNGGTCSKIHAHASKLAMNLGETYIFSCNSGAFHIVFPLVNNGTLLGSILVGPFLMETPDSLLLTDIAQKYHIPENELLTMQTESYSLPVVAPSQVTFISRLLYYMCSGLITDSKYEFIFNQNKFYQQAKINEAMQYYKTTPEHMNTYPYDKEKALITKVKNGDADGAKALLNDILGFIFFSEGSNFDVIKARSVELVSLLSRAAIESGATSDSVLKANNNFIKELQSITNLDILCYKLQESIDLFTKSIFSYIPSKGSEIIKKAIRYISQNYSTDITLNDVAEYVHLNPAYFSSLFKQSTGSSFKEYLNLVRIEESKRLLVNTDLSIMEIALTIGYEDQSYFSKIFKKYTGFTPKQYR